MRVRLAALALSFLAAMAAGAQAHAFLDHAEPKVGGSVRVSPLLVKAWFTQKLVLPFSNLQVFDENGREADLKDKKLDQSNEALLTVSLPALPPGKYKVVWRAVSVDTHVTNGTFTFQVSPRE